MVIIAAEREKNLTWNGDFYRELNNVLCTDYLLIVNYVFPSGYDRVVLFL